MEESWIDRVKRWMRATGTSQESLAGSLGCTRGAVGHYLAGRRQPSLSLLEEISSAMQVHPAWLLYGIGPAHVAEETTGYQLDRRPQQSIPLLGSTASGPTRTPSGFLDMTVFSPTCYALEAVGDGSAPRIHEGEILVLSPDLEPRPGDEVSVGFKDGGCGLFELLSAHDDRLTLGALNDRRIRRSCSPEELVFVHRIVAVLHKETLLQKPEI